MRNDAYIWYSTLVKPSWAPPGWIFGPVWALLYVVIFVTFGIVFFNAIIRKLPWVVALPFAMNLVFNLAFSPIQFGLKNNFLAAIDIILILATLVWAFIAVWPHMPLIAYANIPYLTWVSFATVLQLTITYLNK
ncbi:MAG TPA: tryptophan-rich sensory protein [Candidatus Omnitrophota bacterium]|nr:tryptophan-rich sensory protein [Candidatus Omnitrophota bacterium]